MAEEVVGYELLRFISTAVEKDSNTGVPIYPTRSEPIRQVLEFFHNREAAITAMETKYNSENFQSRVPTKASMFYCVEPIPRDQRPTYSFTGIESDQGEETVVEDETDEIMEYY